MLEVTVIHVGNLKEKYYKEAVSEYAKRLSAYCTYTEKEIKESLLSENPSKKEIELALSKEADMILSAVPQRAYVIALCVEGKEMPSEALAEVFEKTAISGYDKVTFIIGSSYGLSDKIKEKADMKLSFSKMTFPHRLMRVMLAEQIYRAFTIVNGKKYHK